MQFKLFFFERNGIIYEEHCVLEPPMLKKTIIEAEKDFLRLWNEEFKTHPLTERIFRERMHDLLEGSFALYAGSELAALVVLKKGPDFDERAREVCFIALLYVAPKFRRQGLGGSLLASANSQARKHGCKYMLTGCDYDNLFSGVFTEEAKDFFQKHGFVLFEKNYNLTTGTFNPGADPRVRLCGNEEERREVLDLIEKNFHIRWSHELKDIELRDLVVLEEEGRIAGFARISDLSSRKLPNSMTFYARHENLGGLGPLGVDPAFQGRGLGRVLVENAVRLLFLRGAGEVLVDWTEKTEFYRKCGFQTISDEFQALGLIL